MISQNQAHLRNFFDDFAVRIKFMRKSRGLTLAALSGGSASTAKSWEGGSIPRPADWSAVAAALGLSTSFVFAGEPLSAADYEFIAKYAEDLPGAKERLEVAATKLRAPAGKEYPTDHSDTGALLADANQSPVAQGAQQSRFASRVIMNAKHQPPASEPTAQQCADYFMRYLQRASHVPGGLGHVWTELHLHFPESKIEALSKIPPP